jgi:enoyl-CoA hydratase
MSSPTLSIEKNDGVATLTLCRPDAMNALSSELRAALVEGFRDLQADPDVRVAILTGSGRAFCAGLDLKEMSGDTAGARDFGREKDPASAMDQFDGPIIGAINGHAITGGFEIALACDVLIASQAAVFADTHIRVGVLPGWGLSQRLSRLVGIGRAKEISLTGNFVSAERALEIGLVNRVVAPDALMDECRKLAGDMASCDPQMLRSYKRLIDEGYGMNFRDAMAHEASTNTGALRGISSEELSNRRREVTDRGRSQGS